MLSVLPPPSPPSVFFFNDTATTEIYTLSLHDALPIYPSANFSISTPPSTTTIPAIRSRFAGSPRNKIPSSTAPLARSEEHTSELQSRQYLVCRLLLEKKRKTVGRLARQTTERSWSGQE